MGYFDNDGSGPYFPYYGNDVDIGRGQVPPVPPEITEDPYVAANRQHDSREGNKNRAEEERIVGTPEYNPYSATQPSEHGTNMINTGFAPVSPLHPGPREDAMDRRFQDTTVGTPPTNPYSAAYVTAPSDPRMSMLPSGPASSPLSAVIPNGQYAGAPELASGSLPKYALAGGPPMPPQAMAAQHNMVSGPAGPAFGPRAPGMGMPPGGLPPSAGFPARQQMLTQAPSPTPEMFNPNAPGMRMPPGGLPRSAGFPGQVAQGVPGQVPMPQPAPGRVVGGPEISSSERLGNAAAPSVGGGPKEPPMAGQPMQRDPNEIEVERQLARKRAFEQFLSGVGAGASKIQGKGAFASAARGFGGGIGGADERGDKQFDQSKQAREADNRTALAKSNVDTNLERSNLYRARAEAATKQAQHKMIQGSWLNTRYGQANEVEKRVQQWYDSQRKSIDNDQRYSGLSAEDVAKRKAKLETDRGLFRQEQFSRAGLDPKWLDAGKNQKNPIDSRLLSPQERMSMPNGSYFIDENGELNKRDYKKKPPYPGWSENDAHLAAAPNPLTPQVDELPDREAATQ